MKTQPTNNISKVTYKSNPLKLQILFLGHYMFGTETKLREDSRFWKTILDEINIKNIT